MDVRWSNFTLFVVWLVSSTVLSSTPFRRVTLCNGEDLCASGSPSTVFDVDSLASTSGDPSRCTPPIALCSWKCMTETNCTSFNWKATDRTCELFSSYPTTCGFSANCVHYELFTPSGERSCSTDVFSLTGDDSIGQLFIDGMEVTNLPNAHDYYYSDSVPLPPMAQVIAIRVDNTAWIGGILGSSSTFITSSAWKVTTNHTDGWMALDFNDSSWVNADPYAPNNGSYPYDYAIPPISEEAQWISTDDVFQRVINTFYFRYRIHCDP